MTPTSLLHQQHSQIPWQFLLTVRTPGVTDPDEAYDILQRRILRPLTAHAKSCVCAFGVLNYRHNSHIHAVLRAYDPQAIQGLTTDSLRDILKASNEPLGTISNAVDLKPIHDNAGAVQYVIDNYPSGSGKGEFLYAGQWLLDRLYARYPLPIDPDPTLAT